MAQAAQQLRADSWRKMTCRASIARYARQKILNRSLTAIAASLHTQLHKQFAVSRPIVGLGAQSSFRRDQNPALGKSRIFLRWRRSRFCQRGLTPAQLLRTISFRSRRPCLGLRIRRWLRGPNLASRPPKQYATCLHCKWSDSGPFDWSIP
jgi:hypothetical protein